jgi:hypothetical protein
MEAPFPKQERKRGSKFFIEVHHSINGLRTTTLLNVTLITKSIKKILNTKFSSNKILLKTLSLFYTHLKSTKKK